MYQFLFLFSAIAAISLFTSLGIFYMQHRQTIKGFESTLHKIEKEFYSELSTIDLSELSRTMSGRELLMALVFSDKKEANHSQDLWLDPNYRREMIERARENERREREIRNMPRISKEEYDKIPWAT